MSSGSSEDYYALLGIEAYANDMQVRQAWRRLSLQWHPDRAGPEAKATFQKIAEAYEVLSNPVDRAAYDRQRATRWRGESEHRRVNLKTPPARPAPPQGPTPNVMLRRLSMNLNNLLASGIARRAADGVIELYLNAEEATQGGRATIPMRVSVRCPHCASDTRRNCARCGNTRALDELYSAWLALQPGVAHGTILTPSGSLPGIVRPVSFRVRLDYAR